uniref:Uncharacterized protein n=1 Tax=Clytia hemisphaerica TaxID=252671 RepID=A0A7M5VGS3_9CNID|eukprot:TCONS_00070860-protein
MAEFQFNLLDCSEDLGTCSRTFLCPCVTAGENARAVDKSCFLFGLMSVLPLCMFTNGHVRKLIRHKYNIKGSYPSDLLANLLCPCCSLVQDAREIEAHATPPPAVKIIRQ